MKKINKSNRLAVLATCMMLTFQVSAQFKTVKVHDYGMGMTMFTISVPQDWTGECAVALNAYTSNYDQWNVGLYGRRGEVVRIGKYGGYNMMQSQDYVWNQLLGEILSGVSNAQLGQWQADYAFAQTQSEQPGNTQMLVADFQGYSNGNPVYGKVRVMWIQNSSYDGLYQLRAEWSPQRNDAFSATALKIFASQRANPQWSQALQQLTKSSQRAMARRGRSGGSMGGGYSGGGSGSGGSSYNDEIRAWGRGENGNTHTSEDMFTDYIRDENTVENPNTGWQEGVSFEYDYWYINPLGDKYGTNDPFHVPEQGYQLMPGVN